MSDLDAARLSPIDAANLLAGQAVAEAEGCLADRLNAAQIVARVDQLWRALARIEAKVERPPIPEILTPVRLLIMALARTAISNPVERRARWRRVLAALTDLVRHESLALRAAPPDPVEAEGFTSATCDPDFGPWEG